VIDLEVGVQANERGALMSGYELGRMFFDGNRDRERKLAKRFQEDPTAVFDEYNIPEVQREYVLNGDIRSIYETGVHPLLVRMGVMTFIGPIDTPSYRAAIAGAVQARD
jgi:hypothetical protein